MELVQERLFLQWLKLMEHNRPYVQIYKSDENNDFFLSLQVQTVLIASFDHFLSLVMTFIIQFWNMFYSFKHEWVSGACVQMGYLPVQRSLVAIKRVHYDEKFTVLFLQVFHAFALRMIIFYHLHDGHLLWRVILVSQQQKRPEWKFDDKLQILSKNGQENAVSNRKCKKH